MSPPWPDRLSIGLSPSRVAIMREVLGLRGWRRSETSVPLAAPPDGPAWRGAVAALEANLAEDKHRRARVRVVLSNHFVRYAVIPWRNDLRSRAERRAFVRHEFASRWGDLARGWSVRESAGEIGRASLACAVEEDLLEALRGVMEGRRHVLASVQPLFMAAFNEHRRGLGERGALVVSEPGRLCGGVFEEGEWRSTFSVRSGPAVTPAAIERECLLSGAPEDAPTFLCGIDVPLPEEFGPGVRLLASQSRAGPGSALASIGCRA